MTLTLLLVPATFAGPKWEFGEASWMQLSFLGQVHYSFMDYEDTAEPRDEEDFFLRRGRIILSGQVMDGVKFFMETDNDNAGKSGQAVGTDIQDCFADVRLFGDHWVELGLILLPFSFENASSAASLLGIDYNAETIKFDTSFVWRDIGAQFHGHFDKWFSYKVGVFDGYEAANKNPEAGLRFCGHVAFNPIGQVESGWFYTQERFPQAAYVSIGAGFDHQAEATLDGAGDEVDNSAWVLDVQSGFPFGDRMSLTANAAYYDWDNASFDGQTAFGELGFRYDKIMGTAKYSLQDPAASGSDSVGDFTVGFHYFLMKHNARAGIEYRTGDSDDWILAGVQFLL